jgi:hypothetical protein
MTLLSEGDTPWQLLLFDLPLSSSSGGMKYVWSFNSRERTCQIHAEMLGWILAYAIHMIGTETNGRNCI